MEYVIINALLYTVALLIYWRYKHQIDLGFIVLASLTIIGILGIPTYYLLNFLVQRNITLLPYLYLFIVILLFIRPYLSTKGDLFDRIKVKSQNKIELIAYLFIISSFFSFYILLPIALQNIKDGDWNQIRNELYNGDVDIIYKNSFERILLIFNQYFRLISIIIFYYYLTFQKKSKMIIFLLGLSCVIPTVLSSISIASRGMIVNLLIEFLAGFVLFKKSLPNSIIKSLYIISIFIVSLLLFYSIVVTNSRFGENSSQYSTGLTSSLSLLDYFGHPMLTFNDGIASMHKYANGKYFFHYILDALKIDADINQSELGGNWGTSFFTFVGAFYIDFGPWGTLLLSIILPYFIKKNIMGDVIYFENLFLYYFFYIFFLEGIFVTGQSAIIPWLFASLIYLFLKLKL